MRQVVLLVFESLGFGIFLLLLDGQEVFVQLGIEIIKRVGDFCFIDLRFVLCGTLGDSFDISGVGGIFVPCTLRSFLNNLKFLVLYRIQPPFLLCEHSMLWVFHFISNIFQINFASSNNFFSSPNFPFNFVDFWQINLKYNKPQLQNLAKMQPENQPNAPPSQEADYDSHHPYDFTKKDPYFSPNFDSMGNPSQQSPNKYSEDPSPSPPQESTHQFYNSSPKNQQAARNSQDRLNALIDIQLINTEKFPITESQLSRDLDRLNDYDQQD